MWFKNLYIVQLTDPFLFSAEDLEEKLQNYCAQPCGALQPFSYGWAPPLGRHGTMLVHTIGPYHLIAARKESKLLPTSVIREALETKISQIEQDENRKISKKEKASMRDEVQTELMTRAFHRSQTLYAYIDTHNNWLIIDTTNQNKADELLELLRKSLGKLDIATLQTQQIPRVAMSNWLMTKQTPAQFTIENYCQMIDPQDITTIVKCTNHDLFADEIFQHLHAGKQVVELALTWNNQISLVLSDNLLIKRFQLLDIFKSEKAEIYAETEADKFDADFAIMTGAINELLPAIFNLLGNLIKPQVAADNTELLAA